MKVNSGANLEVNNGFSDHKALWGSVTNLVSTGANRVAETANRVKDEVIEIRHTVWETDTQTDTLTNRHTDRLEQDPNIVLIVIQLQSPHRFC